MNKRSAVAVAGGVAGALVSGLAGYSIKLQHPPAAPTAAAATPIVKTQTKTITIHRKPRVPAAAGAPVQTIVVHRAPTVVPPAGAPPPIHHTGASKTAGGEREGGDDGGHDD